MSRSRSAGKQPTHVHSLAHRHTTPIVYHERIPHKQGSLDGHQPTNSVWSSLAFLLDRVAATSTAHSLSRSPGLRKCRCFPRTLDTTSRPDNDPCHRPYRTDGGGSESATTEQIVVKFHANKQTLFAMLIILRPTPQRSVR